MIPIGDDPVEGAPPPFVNILLIILNVLVFFYELSLGDAVDPFLSRWGVIPANIVHGRDLLTLITSQFLHGGWLHIIGNMAFLWVFGDNIEDVLGHFGYLLFYLAAGIVAGLAQVVIDPASTVPNIGASGAIAGVLGAYILLYPHSRIRTLVTVGFIGVTRISAIAFLGFWFVLQLFSGVGSLTDTSAQAAGGVAYFAHIGGFVAGAVVGLLMRALNRPRLTSGF